MQPGTLQVHHGNLGSMIFRVDSRAKLTVKCGTDADRFHSDVSGEEKKRRDEALRRKEQATQFRREQAIEREEARWKSMAEQKQAEEEYWRRQREIGGRVDSTA